MIDKIVRFCVGVWNIKDDALNQTHWKRNVIYIYVCVGGYFRLENQFCIINQIPGK